MHSFFSHWSFIYSLHKEITGFLRSYATPGVGSLIKDELFCWNLSHKQARIYVDTLPSSRRQLLFHQGDEQKKEQYAATCLSPSDTNSGSFSVPSLCFWLFGLWSIGFPSLSDQLNFGTELWDCSLDVGVFFSGQWEWWCAEGRINISGSIQEYHYCSSPTHELDKNKHYSETWIQSLNPSQASFLLKYFLLYKMICRHMSVTLQA